MSTSLNSIVKPMKKVSISISICGHDRSNEHISWKGSAITGVGPNGLSPLEANLCGKKTGDEIKKRIRSSRLNRFLGGFLGCSEAPNLVFNSEELDVTIRIESVKDPEPSEVVKAMAAVAACGCDCGCGCC